MSEEAIPVKRIGDFFTCPRIVYFKEVLGYEEITTALMEEGREVHGLEARRERRRKFSEIGPIARKWEGLLVQSDRLGLAGVVDLIVETPEGLAVVETKNSAGGRRPKPGHLYQAVAYAMLAEEVLGRPVRYVVLRYLKDGRAFKMRVTDEMRRHVLWALSRIRGILERNLPPPFRKRKLCASCGFKKVCRMV